MSLANVAWILASSGKRVLTVDWDLEAPGLHRYFRPFLLDKDLTSSEGILDLVLNYAIEAITPDRSSRERSSDWHLPFANILRYAVSLRWSFPKPGRLDFIPAGKQIPSYATRMNSFDWRNFYERLGGSAFLEAMKERMREEYDYILIDSRTGVSDTSGICTIQMPDILVVCFTLNNQSIDGAASVATSVREQRGEDGILIYPVPMRIEVAEKRKLRLRKEYAKSAFDIFTTHLEGEQQEQYLEQVQYPYIPYYAYEEILATFGDKPGELNTVLAATQHLTSYLTMGEVKEWAAPTLAQCDRVLAYYEKTKTDRDETSVTDDDKTAIEQGAADTEPDDLIGKTVWRLRHLPSLTKALSMAFMIAVLALTWRYMMSPVLIPPFPPQTPTPTPTPENLSGALEQVHVLDNPGIGVQVFILLSINNPGVPTIVQNYSLHITHTSSKSINFNGPPDTIAERYTLPRAESSEVVVIQPQDDISSKTLQALPTSGKVSGWLRFVLPAPGLTPEFVQQPGTKYEMEFADATGKTYRTTYQVQ